jgi:hypothetical protein
MIDQVYWGNMDRQAEYKEGCRSLPHREETPLDPEMRPYSQDGQAMKVEKRQVAVKMGVEVMAFSEERWRYASLLELQQAEPDWLAIVYVP